MMHRSTVYYAALAATVVLAVALVASADAGIAPKSTDECLKLGYHRELVECRSCETLLAHTGSTELHHECLECCSAAKDSEEREVIYTSARIVVPRTTHGLGLSSRIDAFVEQYKDEPYFEHVTVEGSVPGVLMPELILQSPEGDELRIQLYTFESHKIHELLSKKLKL